MSRCSRSRLVALTAAALGGAALLMGSPSTALAKDREARRHATAERHHDGHYDRAQAGWDSRQGRHARRLRHRGGRHHGLHYARGIYDHRAKHHCSRCREHFRSRRAFHRHVHHRHHDLRWEFPFALGHRSLGRIFQY